MNIFHRVTIQTLMKNRTRTVVTIIGIILSASMICAVTTFAQSIRNYLYENAVYSGGDWYGMTYEVSGKKAEELKEDKRTDKISKLENIGYAKINSQNDGKPYLYVGGMDKNFEQSMPVHLTEGRLPENDTEIILPNHLAENGGVKYSVGDTLTLEMGERKSQGYSLYQGTSYLNSSPDAQESETLFIEETCTYTVVGFYERPEFEDYSAPGYTALTLCGKMKESNIYTIYYKTANPADIYQYMDDYALGTTTNWDVLAYTGVSRYDSFSVFLFGLSAIVIGLIMLGSVSLIYNAFSISVSERTKQFGLLASIGATKRQLKHTVLFESLFVSVIGIPIGILCGIGGIGITIHLLAGKIQSYIESGVTMKVSISWWSVLAAVVIALITVLISAWIPSRRATRINPIEAIRMSEDIRTKSKEVKTGRLVYKLFGLEGMIAQKHFKRSRRRYRATVISLFLSIVLFISASSFCAYLTDSVEGSFSSSNYDILCNYADTEGKSNMQELFEQLTDLKEVENGCYVKEEGEEIKVALEDISEDSHGNTLSEDQSARFLFIEDKEYKKILKENNLDESIFMNSEKPVPIIYDTVRNFNRKIGRYETYHILKNAEADMSIERYRQYEEFEISEEENGFVTYVNPKTGETKKVPESEAVTSKKINMDGAARIKEIPKNTGIYEGNISLLYPYSAYQKVIGKKEEFQTAAFYFSVKNHAAAFEEMKTVLSDRGMTESDLYDYAASKEQERNLVFIIHVFAYGFIVLISLIAAANVFHTISTNVALRRREFAMLKSVGMAPGGFTKMMNFECILYGTRALLLGLPASAGVTFLIYRVVNEGFETSFYIPWKSILAAVVSVFLVVFTTMMYSMAKIKKDNPIDALKNENL